MNLLSKRELNTIRDKVSVGHASVREIQQVFGHIDALEFKLEELDNEDFFGTEGFRHFFGYPE